jgi:cysteine desulfurase/selenocysteine lyase
VHGRPLAYLDNAATSQKPHVVIDALRTYYEQYNANIHRGVHELSMRATSAYEQARRTAARFLGAERPEEIVFLRGATEAINLVANTFGRLRVREGDEVLITHMEHHSNIVPWQILCEQTGAKLRVVPINDRGELIMDEFERLLGPRTKIVAVVHISNALGTINPVREMTALARQRGIPVLVDGAQAAPHARIDVRNLGCDFYTMSGHKVFGPTGIGVLYARGDWLERLPPYHGGGEMIKSVTFEKTIYNDVPHKFEAGTPHIGGTVGLATALDYVLRIGPDNIAAHEQDLLDYGTEALQALPGVRLIGTAEHKAAVLSFVVDGVHPHDIGTILDEQGIAVRTGHHCAQPVMDRFGVPATVRASLALYNTRAEIDALASGLRKAIEVFA